MEGWPRHEAGRAEFTPPWRGESKAAKVCFAYTLLKV